MNKIIFIGLLAISAVIVYVFRDKLFALFGKQTLTDANASNAGGAEATSGVSSVIPEVNSDGTKLSGAEGISPEEAKSDSFQNLTELFAPLAPSIIARDAKYGEISATAIPTGGYRTVTTDVSYQNLTSDKLHFVGICQIIDPFGFNVALSKQEVEIEPKGSKQIQFYQPVKVTGSHKVEVFGWTSFTNPQPVMPKLFKTVKVN